MASSYTTDRVERQLRDRLGAACAALVLTGLALRALMRPGYSPDEEITAILAQAAAHVGLPLLPSGIFYNRGLPYTYLASLAGVLGGHTLVAYRTAGLGAAIAGLVCAFELAREPGYPVQAWTTALMLATLPAFVSSAVFARYYSALVASLLLALWLFLRFTAVRRGKGGFLAAVAVTNALHPLGVVLAACPLISSCSSVGDRSLRGLSVAAVTVALMTQVLLYGAHWASVMATGTHPTTFTALYSLITPRTPASFYTIAVEPLRWWGIGVLLFGALGAALVLRRDLVDRVLIALGTVFALAFQPGGLILLVGVTALVDRARASRLLRPIATLFLAAVAWWPLQMSLHTSAAYSLGLANSLTQQAAQYPFAALAEIVSWHPGLAVSALVGLALASRSDDPMAHFVTVVGAVDLLTLAAYDVAGVSLQERYLIVPLVLEVLCAGYGVAALIDRTRRTGNESSGGRNALALASVAALVVWTGWGYFTYALHRNDLDLEPAAARWLAPETGASWTPASFRTLRNSNDVVICTEELACLYLVGRIDYLLALLPDDAAHYVVRRSGQYRGFYAASAAILYNSELDMVVTNLLHNRCVSVVGLSTNKVAFGEYRAAVASLSTSAEVSAVRDDPTTFVLRVCRR